MPASSERMLIRIIRLSGTGFKVLKDNLRGIKGHFGIMVSDDPSLAVVMAENCPNVHLDWAIREAGLEIIVSLTMTVPTSEAEVRQRIWDSDDPEEAEERLEGGVIAIES